MVLFNYLNKQTYNKAELRVISRTSIYHINWDRG